MLKNLLCHLFMHKFKVLIDFIECNILAIFIIFKTLYRSKKTKELKEIIYFHNLKQNNTISSDKKSFLEFLYIRFKN